MKTLGIIAGNGRFPFLVADEAKKQGFQVVIAGLEKEADPGLASLAAHFFSVKIGALAKLIQGFRDHQVEQVIMAGKVEKVRLFQENVRPDLEMLKVLMKTRDFKDDSLLGGIADHLEKKGLRILDSTSFLSDSLPQSGILGKKKPSKEIWEDIRFGWKLAKQIAGLDIGQTVAVRKKAILAVEAIEGTDAAIRRAGELSHGQFTVVKVAKPHQDMRFDVPAIGLNTLKELIQAGASALAFEAGKTIVMDREKMIQEADKNNLILIALDEKEMK